MQDSAFRRLVFLCPRPVSEDSLADAAFLLSEERVRGWWRLYRDCVEWSLLAPLSRQRRVHGLLQQKLGDGVILLPPTTADVEAFHRAHRNLRRLAGTARTRAEVLAQTHPALTVTGIDMLGILGGLACDPRGKDRLQVQVTAAGQTLATVLAAGFVPDLLRRGHPDGLCGYAVQLPQALLTGDSIAIRAQVVDHPGIPPVKLSLQTPVRLHPPDRPWCIGDTDDPLRRAVRAFAAAQDDPARADASARLRQLLRDTPSLFLRDLGIEMETLARGGFWPTYRERLQTRLLPPQVQQINDSKVVMKSFAQGLGLPLPQVHLLSADAGAILRTVRDLGDCVIKPDNASLSRGCLVLQDGVDLFSRHRMSPGDLAAHLDSVQAGRPGTGFIVEELLRVPERTPGVIPPDYRFYVFGAEVALIYVTDLNVPYPGVLRPTQLAHYTSDWSPALFPMRTGYREVCEVARPRSLAQMCTIARKVGQALGTHVRVDMYDTDAGAVLGEVTLFPSAGLRFNDYGEAMMTQAWALFPDGLDSMT